MPRSPLRSRSILPARQSAGRNTSVATSRRAMTMMLVVMAGSESKRPLVKMNDEPQKAADSSSAA